MIGIYEVGLNVFCVLIQLQACRSQEIGCSGLNVPHRLGNFKHLVLSWWCCLEKFRKYSLSGGRATGNGIRAFIALVHSQFSLFSIFVVGDVISQLPPPALLATLLPCLADMMDTYSS